MTEPSSIFFRFPHTPHVAWLGQGQPRGDKVLSTAEAQSLLACATSSSKRRLMVPT